MFSIYRLVSWLYPIIPIFAAIGATVLVRRSGSVAALRTYFRTACLGTILGIALVLAYAILLEGHVSIWQAAVTCWWLTATLLIIQAINLVIETILARLFRLRAADGGRGCCPGSAIFAAVVRTVIVFALGGTYLAAVGLSFRPKVTHAGNPRTALRANYETVSFDATDGVSLVAWWVPAQRTERSDSHIMGDWGRNTVILCPGFGADKAMHLMLARDLVPNGYNVLALDFRAQGESGGHFSTFGDLESRDVLGAVRWLRTQHPDGARRILGLGVNTGAAALLRAAADPGVEGQAIDAVALIEPFDDLNLLVDEVASDHLLPGPGWVANHVALPAAGRQLGTRLESLSPRLDTQALWPRPLLIIPGTHDSPFPAHRAQALYDSALQPKYFLLPAKESRWKLFNDDGRVSRALRVFFEGARSII